MSSLRESVTNDLSSPSLPIPASGFSGIVIRVKWSGAKAAVKSASLPLASVLSSPFGSMYNSPFVDWCQFASLYHASASSPVFVPFQVRYSGTILISKVVVSFAKSLLSKLRPYIHPNGSIEGIKSGLRQNLYKLYRQKSWRIIHRHSQFHLPHFYF